MANPSSGTVFQQIFTDILMEKYRDGNAAVLNEFTSMDHMVSYNTINLSEIGADPEVVENNTTWPLVPTQRTDSGIAIALSTFDTKPTHITNVEEIETNYDKARSVLDQHVNTLISQFTTSALYNIAPDKTADGTPVSLTSGSTLTYKDILTLRTKFNKLNLPMDGRVLVLAPEHEEALLAEDVDRYNQIMVSGQVAGFKVLTSTGLPTYTVASSAATKNAKGVTTGKTASLAFCKSEVMRAMGDINCQSELRWADYRGWLIGAQARFVALPIRSLGIAAIVDK
jgi:hypothetical protein